MKLIDTHSHVYDEAFRDDLSDVIDRAREVGLDYLLLPNINVETLDDMLRVCDMWPDLCRPMIGIHPEDLTDDFCNQLEEMETVLDQDQQSFGPHRFIGIGETGIDLYWDKTRIDDQIESFRVQIEWALKYDLPIVIHSRNSFKELYEVMSDYKDTPLRGVFHCFSGNADEAAALMEFRDFFFGIGGILTYRKSTLPSVIPLLTLDRVVLETDCPYLPPVPYRGQRNEPSYIINTANTLAQICGCTIDNVADVTYRNSCRLFRL